MRIIFNSISLRNYKSFGNIETVFYLDKPDCTLIIGENLDFTSEGKTSNGTGKTSAFEAICYALYDRTPSNISKDNLINNINKKNLEVILKFTKDNIEYSIKRSRKGIKGNSIEILKSGKDITVDSLGRNNDLIQSIIGIPFELFVQIISISASNTTPYFNLPLRSGNSPSQIGMIEELFNLKSLTEKADILKELIKDTKSRLDFKEQKFDLLKKEKERHDAQIKSTEKRIDDWSSENILMIEKIKEQLDDILKINFNEQRSLIQEVSDDKGSLRNLVRERTQLEDNIDRINKTIKRIKDWDANKELDIKKIQDQLDKILEIDIDEQKNIFDELTSDKGILRNLVREQTQLEDIVKRETNSKNKRTLELSHLEDDKCPFCLQKMPDANQKITEIHQVITEHDQNIKISNLRLSNIKTEEQNLTIKIKLLEESFIVTNLDELLKIKSDSESLQIRIKELKGAKNPYVEIGDASSVKESNLRLSNIETEEQNLTTKIKLLEKSIIVDSIDELIMLQSKSESLKIKIGELELLRNPHLETLEELKSITLEEINQSELNDLFERYDHQKFLMKLLTKKDSFVRKNLLYKNIPFLNSRLAHNLKEFGLPHTVKFTHELTADITQFGNQLDFGNLSHGQQARVNLALSFAFRDVLLSMHGFVNILVLDEILDSGLDNVGIYAAVNMIKKKTTDEKLSTYIISHKDEISTLFNKKLKIKMENGFSNITFEK